LLLEARKSGNTDIEQAVWVYPEVTEQEIRVIIFFLIMVCDLPNTV